MTVVFRSQLYRIRPYSPPMCQDGPADQTDAEVGAPFGGDITVHPVEVSA